MEKYTAIITEPRIHPAWKLVLNNFLTLRSLPNFSFKISCKVPTPSIKPSCNDFFPDQNSPENNIE